MEKNDGGPAFAGGLAGHEYGPHEGKPMNDGMSLRDYIATAALQGILAGGYYPLERQRGARMSRYPRMRNDPR